MWQNAPTAEKRLRVKQKQKYRNEIQNRFHGFIIRRLCFVNEEPEYGVKGTFLENMMILRKITTDT